MRGHETTGLLGCDFRYRHRRLELQKGPKNLHYDSYRQCKRNCNCHGRGRHKPRDFQNLKPRSPRVYLIFLSHILMPLIRRELHLFWQGRFLKPFFSSWKAEIASNNTKFKWSCRNMAWISTMQVGCYYPKIYSQSDPRPSRSSISTVASWVASEGGLFNRFSELKFVCMR